MVCSLLFLLLLCCASYISQAYKPVFIVHGLFDGPKEFKTLTKFIQKSHPGTEVTTLDLYDGLLSVKPLWTQVRDFRAKLEARLNQTKEGAHLLCFSQGGVICRGLLSVMPNHNIHSFISLSAPLAGQYGNTDYLKKVFPKYLKKNIYKVCYNKLGQQLSICQYWNGQTSKYFKGPILLCFLICSNVVSSSQTDLELCFVSFTCLTHKQTCIFRLSSSLKQKTLCSTLWQSSPLTLLYEIQHTNTAI
uniref:palmitoyl-CoA hydrolase n=1 Tax=Periophthalmus magnuspinnatus TaxID=409849 RepID=A0A3B4AFL5_9GOBI